jgi:hypothetical protein
MNEKRVVSIPVQSSERKKLNDRFDDNDSILVKKSYNNRYIYKYRNDENIF